MYRIAGKTIVITSDMYLPHDMMQQLLEKNGYSGFEKLYVSCDYGCNKHQKGLYKYLLRDYRGQKIVHVGDNTKADIKCAEECGIKTKYYKGVHEAPLQILLPPPLFEEALFFVQSAHKYYRL